MSKAVLKTWAERLRRAAGATPRAPGAPGKPGPGAAFADEMGHRRAVDGPFLAWRARAAVGERGAIIAGGSADGGGGSVDVRLWRAVLDDSVEVGTLVVSTPGDEPAPVTRLESFGTIEVWTEAELCALHALWRLGLRRGRADLLRRCVLAARWHVEHVQPDNATNHPWGIHVFIIVGEQLGSAEHELHAQAMLHGCQVSLGRPDALSAEILMDAAECLEVEEVRR